MNLYMISMHDDNYSDDDYFLNYYFISCYKIIFQIWDK